MHRFSVILLFFEHNTLEVRRYTQGPEARVVVLLNRQSSGERRDDFGQDQSALINSLQISNKGFRRTVAGLHPYLSGGRPGGKKRIQNFRSVIEGDKSVLDWT